MINTKTPTHLPTKGIESFCHMLPCAICGGLVRPPTPSDGGEWSDNLLWMTKAILLSDPAGEFEVLEQHYRAGKKPGVEKLETVFDADIRLDHAVVTDSDACVLVESGEQIIPYWLAGLDEHGMPYPVPYTIVAHENCVEISIKVFQLSQSHLRVRSLRTLWKVLRTRFDARDHQNMGSAGATGPQYIVMEHGHYMSLSYDNIYSSRDDDGDSHWATIDPVQISNLTAGIIENIEWLQQKHESIFAKTFWQCLSSLPTELQDHVFALLISSDGLPTSCTGLLPQNVWKELLFGRRLLPFLWDIDRATMEKRLGEKMAQRADLNWELLVRKLSQGLTFEGTFQTASRILCYPDLKLPDGLKNRRRIWQLVEEMCVGDVLPVDRGATSSAEVLTIPRYWEEDGEPAYPVLRVGVQTRARQDER